jgi:malate synthase
MQEKYININKLKVSESLSRFVKDELLKDTNISSDDFWLGFEKTIEELEPKNRQLINFRENFTKKN